ncbi:unnamed protein product [Arabis nemorensis]|uniref:Late embryogenesis abundant protein LEA-2 subgroup domain-containing protein n=1 Tax=Arabis nemorensis TaxID=586526 RepID=A0A565CSA8_9BRAS|nr:unnamed protein product [Arabis nemorensis]
MTKTEAPTKKTEVKEEGTMSKHKRVVYSDKRKIKKYSLVAAVLLIIILCVFVIVYKSIQPRPLFILEDLYVDSVSNSSLMVKLLSTNPSSKSSLYYSKIGMRVWVEGNFETERVFLANTFQKPKSVLAWTAAVATNSNNARINGSFQMRDGVTKGNVIVDLSIQWKSGILSSSKFSSRIRCPLLLNLKDLTSAVSKPMSSCSLLLNPKDFT